jgi:hypothetical protein
MLELPAPEEDPTPSRPLEPELGALLEDRLAEVGLDVLAPRKGVTGDVVNDSDLIL